MQHYVCGFLFSMDRSRVLLIRKNRPAWQAGKLNGVGGKVEPGETLHQAMVREFREEATTCTSESDWTHVLTLTGHDESWAGHFFRASGDVEQPRALTDEPLEIHAVADLPLDTIPNLQWMIRLMLDDELIASRYRLQMQVGTSKH